MKSKAQDLYTFFGYGSYFKLNIHERINLRQNRNSLNINWLFSTVISDWWNHKDHFKASFPKVNNGLYHHSGRNHSKYSYKSTN